MTQLTDAYFQLARTQKAEYNQYLSQTEPITVKLDGKVYQSTRRRRSQHTEAVSGWPSRWGSEKLVLHTHSLHLFSVDGNEGVQSPEGGEIMEPGGVSPGITGRTGEPIFRKPTEWGDIASAAA